MVFENSSCNLWAFFSSFYSTCKIQLLYYQFMYKLLYSDVNWLCICTVKLKYCILLLLYRVDAKCVYVQVLYSAYIRCSSILVLVGAGCYRLVSELRFCHLQQNQSIVMRIHSNYKYIISQFILSCPLFVSPFSLIVRSLNSKPCPSCHFQFRRLSWLWRDRGLKMILARRERILELSTLL